MTKYAEGTILTCTHQECNCRVLVQAECHCPGVTDESAYRCACGADLVRSRLRAAMTTTPPTVMPMSTPTQEHHPERHMSGPSHGRQVPSHQAS